MKTWELAKKILIEHGIDKVWVTREYLGVDDTGRPYLDIWFATGDIDDNGYRYKSFKYIDNTWIEIKESGVDE